MTVASDETATPARVVYVRPARASDIVKDLPGGEAALPFKLDPNAIWYAVHGEDGDRLAVLDSREAAFAAARAHDMEPVSVH